MELTFLSTNFMFVVNQIKYLDKFNVLFKLNYYITQIWHVMGATVSV